MTRWSLFLQTLSLLHHFLGLYSLCDEAAAISILQMPFLSGASGHFDGGYLDLGGFHVLDSLSRLAMFDLDGLQRVLSHPDLRDGITSAQAAFVVLLALEQDNPEAAAAIKALPWVQDGITYTPESDDSLLHRNFEEYENESVLALAEMARRSSESFWALLDKSWVRDGYTSSEYQVLSELFELASRDDETTARLLGMPFLESFDKWESLHFMVQVLDDLARDHPSGFRRVLSSPALAGGITSDQKATIALLDLKERNPDAASAMEALPYIQDGISPSEQDGVLATWRAALESDPVFRTLLTKSWVRDGLTPDESLVVHGLANIAGETLAHRDEAAALLIVDMPFLETIDGLDFQVLGSLALLIAEVGTGQRRSLAQDSNGAAPGQGEQHVVGTLAVVVHSHGIVVQSLGWQTPLEYPLQCHQGVLASAVYQFQMFYWRPSPWSDSVHRISCYRGLKRYGKASPTAWSVKDPAMNPATHLEIVFCCLAISDCC